MAKNNYYLTTTLAYVNSKPHIGFAMELILADVMARYQRLLGQEVIFNTGTDEHGAKIYESAQKEGLEVLEYCNQMSEQFVNLKTQLNLSYTNFIRTTDKHHEVAAQKFWELCLAKGDIYKQQYETKYCVGCELEKTDSELVNGKCPLHPNRELEIIAEENYFFRFSRYEQQLLDYYDSHPDFVYPSHRLKEIRNFVASGLKDFSISRLKSKMPWGIPVPGDDTQVMYVWFDALVNYLATLGWPIEKEFVKSWPGIQVCGKDNLRQQTAIWQAMLLSADLPLTKQVLIFGFMTHDGQKISKSLGNYVEMDELLAKHQIDTLRFYLLRNNPFEDRDFSETLLMQSYNSDLADGLGNLVARTANLIEKNEAEYNLIIPDINHPAPEFDELFSEYRQLMNEYRFPEALNLIWAKIAGQNEYLSRTAPWKLKDRAEVVGILLPCAQMILNLAYLLKPFIPGVAEKIYLQFSAKNIKKGEILFPKNYN